jgi:tape measure domain-containing protein
MSDNKAKYEISLVDKYSKKLDQIDKKTADFDTRVLGLGKTLTGVFAGGAILSGITNLSKKALDMAVAFEQTEIAFGTFLGSEKKGRKLVDTLNEFANVTPLTNDVVLKSAKSLLAYDIQANELIPTLRTLGDISAGVGLDKLPNLILAFGQVKAATRLTGMELRQFTEAGVPLLDELAKVTGKTAAEIKEELIPKGKVSFDLVKQALKGATGEGGRFFKMMEKQSKSAGGLVSTLQGKTQLLGVSIGKRLLPAQKALTKETILLVDKLNEWVKIPTAEAIREEQTEVNRLVLRLRDGNTKEAERRDILKQLEKINPDIVKGLRAEKIETGLLSRNLEKYNAEAAKRIVLANLTDEEQKQAVRQADALTRKLDAEDRIRQKLTDSRLKELDAGGDLLDIAQKEIAARNKAIGLGDKTTAKDIRSGAAANQKRLGQIDALLTATAQLSDARKDLSKAEQKSLDIGQRADRLRKLLGLGGSTPPEVVTGKIEGVEDVTAGITKITAAAPKVFNINIGNLVENFEVSTTNLNEGEGEIKDLVTRTLLEGLADVQAIAR